jgi:hypothetical protein
MTKKHSHAKTRTELFMAARERPLNASDDRRSYSIAVLAYGLYEQRGRADGYDLEDWLKAEAIVNGGIE